MKKLSMLAVVAASAFGMAFADAPISVGLKIDHPKAEITKTDDGKDNNSNSRGTHVTTEVKKSVFHYPCKVSCNPPKDKTVTVKVEAYFITRSLEKGAKDELGDRIDVETFEFGGENPKQYKFDLASPAIEQTTVTKKTVSRRNIRTQDEKSGKRLMGVIVRAVVDGKPVKVVSEPSNMRWIAAGKKDTVELQ